jgi:hypothetical protein
MRDRQSIIGFTEAELGLILTLVALALWATALPKQATKDAITVPKERLEALEDTARLARNWKQTRDSLLRSVGKRSNLTPTCQEKGYDIAVIATITVLGNDNFEMNGEVSSIVEILNQLDEQQQFANAHGCRHGIIVKGKPGLSVEQFTPGFSSLRRYFNTRVQ